MSAAVVTNKDKKPQYKDYVTFLGTYKNGKKEEQCNNESGISFSLTNSSNNSSSSINSDLSDAPKKGFKDYLDYYNNKKYSPVQPSFVKKQKEGTKTVKTEVFIEINNTPPNNVSQVCKVFEIPKQSQHVNEKTFDKDGKTTVESKVNMFENELNGQEEQKKVSIGEISKKFENNTNKPSTIVHVNKHTLKKKPSISKMSRVFEDSSNTSQNDNKEVEVRKNILNEVSQVFKQKEYNTPPKSNELVSPKPQIQSGKPVFVIKQENIVIPPPPPPPFMNMSPPQINVIPPSKCSSPAPPDVTTVSNIPPPPPPPPANFTSPKCQPAVLKIKKNGYNTLPKMQNIKQTDVVDASGVPKLDKNDPRVKKLVYGALREMYGSYHDKANDYLATLPKNRVKKNNGLDSIINSIASHGGLEKLNGRVKMTSVENE